jgi:transcriptional regulator with XRE-family HTH domain
VNNQAGEPNHLKHLREAAGLTQAGLAEAIGVDSNSVSRWERGKVIPYLSQQRRIAEQLGVAVTELGIQGRPPADPAAPSPFAFLEELPIAPADRRITDSQEQWQRTRRALNVHRAQLTETAARAYGDQARLDGTTLLTRPDWLPDQPVDLAGIELRFEEAPAPAVDGAEPETAHVRPLADIARPYHRYTQAIQDIARPRLFQNRLSWRPLGVDWTSRRGQLRFGETTYFATMDHHEALAHEVAYVYLDANCEPTGQVPALRTLPFRRLLRDPFDLARRPSIASVSTLVVRGGPEPTFLLHRRDSSAVAIAGSMIHVIPTGVFQPSSILPAAKSADFDLWRNVQRELSEELLGNDEHDGNGHPVDYGADPFASLDAARAAGTMRATCVGVGLDALTLATEILTTLVIDPDVFDDLAQDFVTTNDEGTLVAERLAFDEVTVKGVLETGRMAPAAAGLLALAWKHRGTLLG